MLDFGYEVAHDDIILFSSEGVGWGAGQTFQMLRCAGFGSLKLTKRLPVFVGFCLTKVVIYPRLVHALKNCGRISWETLPSSVMDARRKLDFFTHIARDFRKYGVPGGYRVEFRCKGWGDQRDSKAQLGEFLSSGVPFSASVSTVAFTESQYLHVVEESLRQLGEVVSGQNSRSLGPVVHDAYKLAVEAFGVAGVTWKGGASRLPADLRGTSIDRDFNTARAAAESPRRRHAAASPSASPSERLLLEALAQPPSKKLLRLLPLEALAQPPSESSLNLLALWCRRGARSTSFDASQPPQALAAAGGALAQPAVSCRWRRSLNLLWRALQLLRRAPWASIACAA